jgi:hypothetical protein
MCTHPSYLESSSVTLALMALRSSDWISSRWFVSMVARLSARHMEKSEALARCSLMLDKMNWDIWSGMLILAKQLFIFMATWLNCSLTAFISSMLVDLPMSAPDELDLGMIGPSKLFLMVTILSPETTEAALGPRGVVDGVILDLNMETGEGALSTVSMVDMFSTDWVRLQAEKTGFVWFSAMGDRVGTMVGVELDLVK